MLSSPGAGYRADDDPLDAALSFLRSMIRPGPLLVAVSGGGDSMALLAALDEACALIGTTGCRLVAATVDHALRPDSAEEAHAVAEFCASRGIEHCVLEWRGDKPASGVQAKARMARYRLLAQTAEAIGAIGIATAHTFDDQAETVAMRAARVDNTVCSPGLAGMAPATLYDARTWVLRPFLALSRASLRRFLVSRGIGWTEDPSNSDDRYERVRLRRSGDLAVTRQTIAASQQRRQSRSEEVAACLAGHAVLDGGAVVTFEADGSLSLDPGFHETVALAMVLVGGRPHRLGAATAGRLAAFVESGRPGRMPAGHAMAERRRDRLYIYRERRGLPCVRLQAGQESVYDGRYFIGPSSSGPVTVAPGVPDDASMKAARPDFAGATAAIASRALAGEPVVAGEGFAVYACAGSLSGLPIARRLALFDVFLPWFEITVANECAALFGRDAYRAAPVAL